MSMIEQMIETRVWKEFRGHTETGQCSLGDEEWETVQHLLAGHKMVASREYLARHKSAYGDGCCLSKKQNLLDQNVKWYQQKWNRGHILESSQSKLVRDFEFNLPKMTTSRTLDLMLEEKQMKNILISNVVRPKITI